MKIGLSFGAQTLLLAVGTGLLSGCVSMLPHLQIDDNGATGYAKGMAMAMTCVENGMTDGSIGYPLAHALSDLLSLSVYNKSLYENTYRQSMGELARYPTSAYAGECEKVTSQAPGMTQAMRERYQGLLARRGQAAAAMSQSMANFRPGGYAAYNYVPMPSGKVTFGQQPNGPRTQYFLVNTGSGQRQCSVTQSGYVNCM